MSRVLADERTAGRVIERTARPGSGLVVEDHEVDEFDRTRRQTPERKQHAPLVIGRQVDLGSVRHDPAAMCPTEVGEDRLFDEFDGQAVRSRERRELLLVRARAVGLALNRSSPRANRDPRW
jgi:hypothetical protein